MLPYLLAFLSCGHLGNYITSLNSNFCIKKADPVCLPPRGGGGSVVVQLVSPVQLFAAPWAAAHRASLSFIVSWSLLKLTSAGLVMLPTISDFPLALALSQHQALFQGVGLSHQVAKVSELRD